MSRKDLALLLDMKNPDTVFHEVVTILRRIFPSFDTVPLKELFDDIVSLYSGRYPGYRGCNTGYHDLRHTTDIFLCMTRLIHGTGLEGTVFTEREIFLGLAASLMHDSGYIQDVNENDGTGAKYTREHVQRSVSFMQRYFEKKGFSKADFEFAKGLVLATSVDLKLEEISFSSDNNLIMGKMMFASDLIGQIADRIYIEKLLFLYREFDEGKVGGFESEWDMLNRTRSFYEYVIRRLGEDLALYSKAFRRHFVERWEIDNDYYTQAMDGNIRDLSMILEESGKDYRQRLRREGIVRRIEEMEAKERPE